MRSAHRRRDLHGTKQRLRQGMARASLALPVALGFPEALSRQQSTNVQLIERSSGEVPVAMSIVGVQ
jgi:hypothetical protein